MRPSRVAPFAVNIMAYRVAWSLGEQHDLCSGKPVDPLFRPSNAEESWRQARKEQICPVHRIVQHDQTCAVPQLQCVHCCFDLCHTGHGRQDFHKGSCWQSGRSLRVLKHEQHGGIDAQACVPRACMPPAVAVCMAFNDGPRSSCKEIFDRVWTLWS